MSLSPPLSPLTYNASDDDIYVWSVNSNDCTGVGDGEARNGCHNIHALVGNIDGHIHSNDSNGNRPNSTDNSSNNSRRHHHRIISEELAYIQELEPTPKAGNATNNKKRVNNSTNSPSQSDRKNRKKKTPSPTSDQQVGKNRSRPTPRSSHKKHTSRNNTQPLKMSDSSIHGMLSGQRKEDVTNCGRVTGTSKDNRMDGTGNHPNCTTVHHNNNNEATETIIADHEDNLSPSSFKSVWRKLYRARKKSHRHDDNDKNEKNNSNNGMDEVKRNDTPGTSSEDEESLRELEENDAFALEVGLML